MNDHIQKELRQNELDIMKLGEQFESRTRAVKFPIHFRGYKVATEGENPPQVEKTYITTDVNKNSELS